MTEEESPLIYVCYSCLTKVHLAHMFSYGSWSKGKCEICGEHKPRVQIERVRFNKLMEDVEEDQSLD